MGTRIILVQDLTLIADKSMTIADAQALYAQVPLDYIRASEMEDLRDKTLSLVEAVGCDWMFDIAEDWAYMYWEPVALRVARANHPDIYKQFKELLHPYINGDALDTFLSDNPLAEGCLHYTIA